MVLQATVSLLNIGARRLGLVGGPDEATPQQENPERDLEQVRDAIDAVRGLMPVVERRAPQEARPLRDALSQLQMAYAREAQGATAPTPAPAQSPPPGRSRPPQPPQPGAKPGAAAQRSRAAGCGSGASRACGLVGDIRAVSGWGWGIQPPRACEDPERHPPRGAIDCARFSAG